jgi:hypothetical protein
MYNNYNNSPNLMISIGYIKTHFGKEKYLQINHFKIRQ